MSSGTTAKVLFDYVAEQPDELSLKIGDIITNVIQEDEGWWKGELNGKSGMFPENFVSLVSKQPDEPAEPVEPVSSSFKALVKFDYDPEQNDELKLKEGETIEVTEAADEGWWKGRIHGKEGMFPSNFVEKVDASKPSPEPINKPLPLPDTENKPEQAESNVMASLFSGINPGDARNRLKKVAKPAIVDQKDETYDSPPPFRHEPPKPMQKVSPMNLDHEDIKKVSKKIPMVPPTDAPKVTKPVQKAKALYDYEPEQPDELRLAVGMIITVIASELTFDGWMNGEVDGNVGIFPDNFVELLPLEQSEHASVEVKDEAVPKPPHGIPMLPPGRGSGSSQHGIPPMFPPSGGNNLQNELSNKLAQKPSNNNPPLPQLKGANKAPPPPLPGNKPSLPGLKPKPTLPHSRPVKPPFGKPDRVGPSTEPSPDAKPPVQNQPSLPKPVLPKVDLKPPVVKTPDIENKTPPSANTNSKPSIQSSMSNELSQKMSQFNKTPHVKDSKPEKTENSEIKLEESPSPLKSSVAKDHEDYVQLENGHSTLSVRQSLQLDDVKPTNALKHFDRAKPPGKTPPGKFKDKSNVESPPSTPPPSNTKEVNELKTQVIELQTRMEEMEKKFKSLLNKVTDDLATERKLRLNQEVEIDNLKSKVGILLG